MNKSIEQQNAIIERNLSEAHQQISVHPEFVERVLGAISDEMKRKDAAARLATERACSRRNWRRVAVLAAALLIAILWSTWSPDGREIAKIANETEVGKNEGGLAESHPWNQQPGVQPDVPSDDSPRRSGEQAVKAAEGYLASKLYDDEELEIFLVLPTQKTIFQFQ